jgi:hypothetical protein
MRSPAERRSRLYIALEALRPKDGTPASPAVAKLAAWMNTWKGLGAVVDGMTAQGFDVELQQYPHGWWAKFYLTSAVPSLYTADGGGAPSVGREAC